MNTTYTVKKSSKAALDHHLGGYEAAIKAAGTSDCVTLSEALHVLAAHFFNPVEGYRGTYNSLSFNQKAMLGNMIQNAVWMHTSAHDFLAKEKHKLAVMVAQNTGDEISLRNIAAQIDRVERTEQVQLPAIEEMLDALCPLYEVLTGEVWAPRASTGDNPLTQSTKAINERLKSMGLKLKAPVGEIKTQTDGTESAA